MADILQTAYTTTIYWKKPFYKSLTEISLKFDPKGWNGQQVNTGPNQAFTRTNGC